MQGTFPCVRSVYIASENAKYLFIHCERRFIQRPSFVYLFQISDIYLCKAKHNLHKKLKQHDNYENGKGNQN